MERLLQAAQVRLDACGCTDGCLSCVHMAGCSEYNEGLNKAAARDILRWLIQGELPAERRQTESVQSEIPGLTSEVQLQVVDPVE